MTWNEFAVRLGVAFLLGSVIGLERQWRQGMAGLRTNTLVSTGAAMFVMLGVMTPEGNQTQIPAYVVSGVGFLGGGVILRQGVTVQGLNTAATLWCAAATGSLAGSGFISQAVVGAVAILIANILLRPLARRINQQSIKITELEFCYRCSGRCGKGNDANAKMDA